MDEMELEGGRGGADVDLLGFGIWVLDMRQAARSN